MVLPRSAQPCWAKFAEGALLLFLFSLGHALEETRVGFGRAPRSTPWPILRQDRVGTAQRPGDRKRPSKNCSSTRWSIVRRACAFADRW